MVSNRVAAGFLLALVVLVGNAWASFASNARLFWAEQRVARTQEVLGAIRGLMAQLRDAESGQRGYLLTGDRAYLAPYEQAVARLPTSLAALRRLTADTPLQRERLALLEEKIKTHLDELARTITLKEHRQIQEALARVRSDHGKDAMDDVLRLLSHMEEEADTQLGAEMRLVRLAHDRAVWSFALVTIVAVLLVLLAYRLVRRDLMQQRRAEEAHARLAAIVENSDDAILSRALDGRITAWNAAAERLSGYAAAEVLGQPLSLLLPPGQPGEPAGLLERLSRGEAAPVYETTWLRKDGTSIEVSLTVSPLWNESRVMAGTALIARDVTQQRQLEERLRQAEKMQAMGRLAGGVSHDFNNLLTVINGYGALLLEALPEGDSRRESVEAILLAGERASGLTRQLLAFSRKQSVAPRVLDLNALVTDTDKMLRRVLGEDVELATCLQPDLGPVKADPGQLDQVLMNLAVNARDAMPRGGKLTLETRNVHLDDSYIQVRPDVRPGPYVLLAVSDTGSGMTEEVKQHLFEPFFTTKEPGKGTGLGLATVFGIIRGSGGYIEVYSEPGRGTTFKIYLPRVEEPTRSAPDEPASAPRPHGDETILLVEDDQGVRTLAREVLTGLGYTVLEASEGAEALRRAADFPGTIHLLATDVVMPALGGRQVAEALHRQRPNTKVLYLSGYTDDAVIRHGVLEGEAPFLQKPFSPLTLAQKIREVLDASRHPA